MTDHQETPVLIPEHQALITESGIIDAVARARGYRSITAKARLAELGFGRQQQRVPALLVPIHNVHGEVELHQIRPDTPRCGKNGKAIKYETPSGARMMLDIPPTTRRWIGDPHRPLFITEGVRKADSAVSLGLCCIDVLGVWNWRGRNSDGGLVALPDWELVALKNRDVYIAYDGDVVIKIEVGAALRRLKEFLASRGASVHVIRLPLGDGGTKVGLDDYLAAGHSVDELLALASEQIPTSVSDKIPSAHPYLIDNNRICFEKDTRDGSVIIPLCNFDARITEEVTLDDGDEQSREFVVSGKLDNGRPLPPVRVPADRFASMNWVTNSWGVVAVPAAGMGKRDQLREAMQRLSDNVQHRRIYTHSGWREIDGQHCYLTTSGAVGRDNIEVDLGPGLQSYSLPTEPEDEVEGVRQSLSLLKVATTSVTLPVWAAVFRAPLATLLPIDLYVWIDGFTGSLKSSLTAVFLSHWGRFTHKKLPGNWESTANALEKHAHKLKDAMFVVDDFAPHAVDIREYRLKAARLLRSQGNLTGRGRLRSDLTDRKTFHPRGMILSTGEQRPTGQSILARGFFLELERSQVDLDLLTEAQAKIDRLPHAMAGYVRWLAPQVKSLGSTLHQAFETARAKAVGVGAHLRHPEALAHMWIGLDCGLAYAEEIGALDVNEATELRSKGWEVLVERATAMGRLVDEESPTRRFAEILSVLLLQNRATLLHRDTAPSSRPDDRFIGWQSDEHLFLIPDAVFRVVSQFAKDTSDLFPVDRRRLQQDFVREGIADHQDGRTTTTVRVGGQVRRVLKVRRAALAGLSGTSEFPQEVSPVTDVTDVTGFGE